jgi:outer membrane protein TolC
MRKHSLLRHSSSKACTICKSRTRPRALARATFLTLSLVTALVPLTSAQPLRITVKDAVLQTIARNPDLAAARMEVDRADAMVTEAWGSALPKFDLNASYTRAIKKPVFFLPGDFFGMPGTVQPVEIGSTYAFLTTLSASQVLFNSAVFVGVGASKIYSRAARQMYQAKSIEFVTRTKKAFYSVLVTRDYLNVAVQTQKNVEENLRNVRLLAKQGLVSEYDQLRAEVTAENVKPEVINAENAYQLAMNNLKTVMALPYDTSIEAEGSLEYVPVDDSLLARAQPLVLSQNPALAGIKSQAEVNDAIVSAQKSEYLPVLSAFGNYQYQGQNNEFRGLTDNIIASSQVGLTLTLNLFNGLQTTARVEQAQVDYKKALEQVNGVTQNLQTSTEAVLLQLNKARRQIEAQGRTVEQAERGYKIATTRYTSGLGTLLEVNDAQLALVRANVNRIQAIFDYMVASADLDQLLGRFPDYVMTEPLE